jgi:hypothetical protein
MSRFERVISSLFHVGLFIKAKSLGGLLTLPIKGFASEAAAPILYRFISAQ